MPELLELHGVSAGYGDARILHGIDLAVPQGCALALLGRNGTGKTTLVNTVMGGTRLFGGRIILDSVDITRAPSHRRARAGLGWVPQERNIFPSLTVEENMTAVARPGRWGMADAYELFPQLKERRGNRGGQLSGGEQQMLAIARALVTNPKLLMLDEPLEGLAPVIVAEILRVLGRLVRDGSVSVVIVEQNALSMLEIAERAVVLERGEVVYSGASAELRTAPLLLERYLGLGAGAS